MNNEIYKSYPGIRQSVALTFVFIVLFVLSSWAIQLGFTHGNTPVYYIVNCIRYVLAYGTIIALAFYEKRKHTPPVKLLHTSSIGIQAYLIITLAFFFESKLEWALLSLLPPMPSWVIMYHEADSSLAYILTLSCIIAPVCEEIIFRGIILEGLLKRYHAPAAIFISAVLFGTIHLNIWQFTAAFADGLLFGWIYYKTRSVLPTIWLHMLNNLIAVWLLRHYVKSSGYADIDYPSPSNLVLITSFILAIVTPVT